MIGTAMLRRFKGLGLSAALSLSLVAVCGCGSDYSPPDLPTTGAPAAALGQVIDLEVTLPQLLIQGAVQRGVELELTLHVEAGGFGERFAKVEPGLARWDQASGTVEDLSVNGGTTVFASPTSWTTGRIGPLRVADTVFELTVRGDSIDGGWSVAGESWESQSGLPGTFAGWRRQRFLLTTTDFFASGQVAEVAWVKQRELRLTDGLELVSSDPELRVTGGAVFVINRFTFDNLQRLDPDDGFRTAWQAGTGAGSNPHDVLMLDDERAFVSRYEPPFDDVARFTPKGGTVRASIPLEEEAENRDGTPRLDRLAYAGGYVFAGMQDIDRTFTRYAEGKLAVIDPDTDSVAGVVALGGKNPGVIEVVETPDGERLYVALAGIFPGLVPRELSGGVVVVDPVDWAVESWALDDDDAGGNIGGLAMVSPGLGYTIVVDEQFRSSVVAFDPVAARPLRTVRSTPDFLPEIALGGSGLLAVPERSFVEPKVCLYRIPADPQDAETALGCVNLGLPPFAIEALD
ncbi:hypothetical protein ABI59_13085 [Acidobacteria bacterium Mor1]|nr:hypothetical protein ABI59_13085 [Acidobacteria bacterium Mor1]